VEAKFVPKNAFKRLRLEVRADAGEGVTWLDDLALSPIGAAGTPVAPSGMLDGLDDKKEPARGGMDEEIAALQALDKSAGPRENMVRNPGFEELSTNGVVTLASDVPSPVGPTAGSNTWMAAGAR
jgi:hypothetical protein